MSMLKKAIRGIKMHNYPPEHKTLEYIVTSTWNDRGIPGVDEGREKVLFLLIFKRHYGREQFNLVNTGIRVVSFTNV